MPESSPTDLPESAMRGRGLTVGEGDRVKLVDGHRWGSHTICTIMEIRQPGLYAVVVGDGHTGLIHRDEIAEVVANA